MLYANFFLIYNFTHINLFNLPYNTIKYAL